MINFLLLIIAAVIKYIKRHYWPDIFNIPWLTSEELENTIIGGIVGLLR